MRGKAVFRKPGGPELGGRVAPSVLAILVVLLAISRIAALPASLAEQDEAYLAMGVRHFAPSENHPHPPWFPLWILIGKCVAAAGVEPWRALSLASSMASVVTLFPLLAMWRAVLAPRLALAAAALYLFVPGAWLLSGRAFSETPATALLLGCAALWIRPLATERQLAGGSVLAGACLLVRAHMLPAVVGLLLFAVARRRTLAASVAAVAPMVAVVTAGYAALALAAGGVDPLVAALRTHAAYHFRLLPSTAVDFASSGLSRNLLTPWAAAAWLVLGLVGAVRSRPSALLFGGLVPTLVVLLLVNPGHPRYFLPVLALSSGFVAAGAEAIAGRFALPALAAGLFAGAAFTVPALGELRRETAPPLAALRAGAKTALARQGFLVGDRTLAAFDEYLHLEQVAGRRFRRDSGVFSGLEPPPPPPLTVYVFDAVNRRADVRGERETTYSFHHFALRRVSQGRFVDVVVSEGAWLGMHRVRKRPPG